MDHDPFDPGAPGPSRGPRLAIVPEPPAGAALTPAQARLVDMMLPKLKAWAKHVAQRFCRRVDPRDLHAPGVAALQEAARTFQEGRTTSFPTYAKHHVRGRMIDAVRAELFSLEARVERRMERAYEILTTHQVVEGSVRYDDEADLRKAAQRAADEVAAMTYVAGLLEAQAQEVEDEVIAGIDFRRALSGLHTVEREVMELVSRQGMTYDEAAKKLAVHPGTIRRRHASALGKLKKILGKPETDDG